MEIKVTCKECGKDLEAKSVADIVEVEPCIYCNDFESLLDRLKELYQEETGQIPPKD